MPWPDGSIRWARNTLTPLDDGDRVVRILVTFVDVTELRSWKEELESSLTELIARDVAVCQGCQRVEENGEWWTMGEYMQRHTRLAFSHGICAPCLDRYFGEHQDDSSWKP
ncbi:MAG: hypothetical protein U5R48_18375 [Gammaproteobacteria bacterium]|nr:hypothetical protein [Gammaproteobacteria bacterium]